MSIYSKIIFFCEVYLLCMFIFFLILGKKRKNRFEFQRNIDLLYIIKKNKLNVSKMKYKLFVCIVNICNSFIIALTVSTLHDVNKYIYKLLLEFVMVIILVYVSYEIIGKIFKKKEE